MRMAFARGGNIDLDTVPDNTKGIDPVSGNEVPIGSTASEVRDDIPAQLSEGEYVVPADVVRYYGVKFFEELRAKAKFGYQDMSENGRIGGEPSDEPDMDMMFDVSELEVEDDGKPMAMADGGYALSPGDEGYDSMGALGLGSTGITAGYESSGSAPTVEVRTYVNEAGHSIYITFINGSPQTTIPPGYTIQAEVAEAAPAAAIQPEPQVVASSGGSSSRPMPAPDPINYKELTNEEIKNMLEDQTSAKSTAIAFGAGAVNPVFGIFVKLAMMDSARRLDKEIERRIAAEETSTSDKAILEGLLEASKKDKPGLITRVFGALKEEFFPQTEEEAKALEIAKQMDAGVVIEGEVAEDITNTEEVITPSDLKPVIEADTKLQSQVEKIAPTTGRVGTYLDPITREAEQFESYGQVTRNGVYAGDGFEWYKTDIKGRDGVPVLGRRYTGTGEDNGLGQDTIVATELGYGDLQDRDAFVKIAELSLEEGSEFSSTQGSANDGDFLEFLRTGSFGASESFAAQNKEDFTPTLTYGDALNQVKESKPYVPETVDAGNSNAYVPISPELETQMSSSVNDAALSLQEKNEANLKLVAKREARRAKEIADRQAQTARRGQNVFRDSMVKTGSVAKKAQDRGASTAEIKTILKEGKKASQKMSQYAKTGNRPTGFKEGGLASKKKNNKKK